VQVDYRDIDGDERLDDNKEAIQWAEDQYFDDEDDEDDE
jgi:hypothetical protein